MVWMDNGAVKLNDWHHFDEIQFKWEWARKTTKPPLSNAMETMKFKDVPNSNWHACFAVRRNETYVQKELS